MFCMWIKRCRCNRHRASIERRTHYHSLSNTFPHLCFIRTKCHIKQALKKQAIFKATCELKTKLTPNTKTTTAIYWIEKTKTKKHLHATNNTEVNKRCLSGFCHSVLKHQILSPDGDLNTQTPQGKADKHLIYTAFAYQGFHMHSRMDWKHSCYSHTVHNSHFLLKNHLGFHILEAGTDLPIICFSKLKLLNILLPKTNKGEQLHLQKKPKGIRVLESYLWDTYDEDTKNMPVYRRRCL